MNNRVHKTSDQFVEEDLINLCLQFKSKQGELGSIPQTYPTVICRKGLFYCDKRQKKKSQSNDLATPTKMKYDGLDTCTSRYKNV